MKKIIGNLFAPAESIEKNLMTEKVKKWFKNYEIITKSGDLEAYRGLWTEDVVWLPIGYPILQGIESCMEMAKAAIKDYVFEQSFTVENVLVSDSLIIASFSLKEKTTSKKDDTTAERASIGTFVLKLQSDNSLVVTHSMWYDITP